MSELLIKTSTGDVIDRLTILNIKSQKIDDEDKLIQIDKEKTILNVELESYLKEDTIHYYYTILERINKHIWELLDNAKYNCKNSDDELGYYREQEDYNERRFRVKRMIDNYNNSMIKEQKGYKLKKCYVLTHLGLGDHIYHGGMIRYLTTIYDKVIVVCLISNLNNLKLVFADILNIVEFITVNEYTDANHYNQIASIKNFTKENKIDEYFTGSYRRDKQDQVYDYPFSWYDIVNIKYSVFWDYSYIPKPITCSEIYSLVKDIKYAFIHNTCSGGKVFDTKLVEETFNINREDVFIINPCVNIYKQEHKFHELGEKFLKFKILEYITVMENAEYIMLSDSSFFGLAHHLKIKTNNRYYFNRGFDYEHLYSEKYKSENMESIRFKKINVNNVERFPGPYKPHVEGGAESVKISVINEK